MKTLHKRSILGVAVAFAIGTAAAQTTGTTPSKPAQGGPQPQLQKGFTGEHRSGVWSCCRATRRP